MMLRSSVRSDDQKGPTIKAIGLNKWVRKDLNLLQDISLVIQPNEFIVVVGQSGGGKSTLVDALTGYRPATHGQVLVNDVDVYKNFESIRTIVGYVPQKDIIHLELTVYEALDYAARLRMPPSTKKADRHARILEVLTELDLLHRRDTQVSRLSGGQQKRVSIGVELLTRPKLFFLDEPTSGLDPGAEASLMHLLRKLASQGRTIVLITHATKNVMLADKVIFLSRGGFLSWFGPPKEALGYFDQYRQEEIRALKIMEFDEIYALLDDAQLGSPKVWADRYKQTAFYRKYIAAPLREEPQEISGGTPWYIQFIKSRFDGKQIPPWRQFFILSLRNIRILTRDKSSLVLMLLAAPLVSCLDLLIAPIMGREVYDQVQGVPVGAIMTLFLMTLYSLMVSSLSQMREIVKEKDIYQRERLVFLRLIPYVLSKIWVALLLAAYQTIAYTGIHSLAFHMPGGQQELLLMGGTVFLGTFAGMLLGLFASAVSPNAASAPMVTIILIIPSVVLSGAIVSLPQPISAPSISYWTFKTLVGITGVGSDVAADACWKMPKELITTMTLDDKAALGCRCMGMAVFDPSSCYFPGNGKYNVPELSQSPPQAPRALRDPPKEPEFPTAPEAPTDMYDKVQAAVYLNALQDYQVDIERTRDLYQTEFSLYQMETEIYQGQMTVYQKELSRWYVVRSAAVGSAEGNIKGFMDRFGWAFISKQNPLVFLEAVKTNWLALGVIQSILLVGIFIAMKIKDRR